MWSRKTVWWPGLWSRGGRPDSPTGRGGGRVGNRAGRQTGLVGYHLVAGPRADLPRLWHAETSSPRDRKRLLRSLVADVTLLPEPDAHTMRIGVRWHTGATDELAVARRGPGRTPPAALEVIREHGGTRTSAENADMLNTAGLTTGKGKPFTAGGVARVRDACKIFGPRTVAVQDGEVSVKQAAVELGIPADAVYNWLRLGQVPARRGPSGRWCIRWDPATQEIYREKVSGSFRLKPVPPAQAGRSQD